MPLLSTDSTQLNQIAIRIAAGLASALALLAVLLHQDLLSWIPQQKQSLSVSSTKSVAKKIDAAPIVSPPVSLQPRIAFCAQHVTPERSFVVFQNGTCVIVNEPSEDPIVAASEILEKASGPEARFITKRIEDGHLMVTYREPVFHCLFAPEIEDLGPTLGQTFSRYLSPGEKKSMPANWSPPADAKLGLYTRQMLNQDAAQMKVAKVVRSRPILPNEENPSEDSPVSSRPSSRPAPLQVIADGSKLSP